MSPSETLSAQEAASLLGVKAQTLYSYVSRGMIRSAGGPDRRRSRRYDRGDVEALKRRNETRRDPLGSLRGVLDWGAPILESSLTLIQGGRLYYRGHDATELAAGRSIEEVAALFWLDDTGQAGPLFRRSAPDPIVAGCLDRSWKPGTGELPIVIGLQSALASAGALDLSAYDLTPRGCAQTGSRILRLMTALAARAGGAAPSIAATLAAGWTARPSAEPALNAALVLCADHELNVSSFTSRTVASAQSNPYQVVVAGLAALQGVRHGGSTQRAEELLRAIARPADVRRRLGDLLARGEPIPGFGHRLYPSGDPRGRHLLRLAGEVPGAGRTLATAREIEERMRAELGLLPNLDFGLAVLSAALGLPAGSGLALFAIGRTVGWIGHAIEQYAQQRLVRPRATYTGRPPGGA